MQDSVRQFSISQIQEVVTENSLEFCYARICVLSTKPNTHKVLITEDILRRDGSSVLGKWIVCDFSQFTQDATTHTNEEKIVGIVPHNARIDFIKENDGTVSMYVDAIISKIYATDIYNMFKKDNFRNVSVEMLTKDKPKLADGSIPIERLNIVGITILGKTVNGSCPNANMSIVKFSIDEAEKYYESESNLSKEFSSENLVNKEDNLNKEDTMEEEKNLSMSVETDEQEDVVMETEQVEDTTTEDTENQFEEVSMEEETESNGEETESETEEEMACETEEMAEETDMACDKDMACGDKEMECGKEMESETEMDCGTQEMAEETCEEEETDNEKAFSIKSYMSKELDSSDELLQKIFEMSADEIIDTIIDFAKEIEELKQFKEEKLAVEKDSKLNAIMASVKEDLDEKVFAELREEGKALSIEELNGFENKVKAFAYEATKTNKKQESEEEIMRFAGSTQVKQEAELTADDIYNKYL